MTPLPPYYIVVSSLRGPAQAPSQHLEPEPAEREARRLAILNPEDAFTVFESVATFAAPRVVVQEYGLAEEDDDDVPF